MAARKYTINFTGDVMLGRLIDQLFSTHVDEPSEANIVTNMKRTYPELSSYDHSSPWGTMLPLLHGADLNIINLETSVTTHSVKWPDKVFNYRMHPENITALQKAKIDYVSLANNHTLDFGETGLQETVRTLRQARVSYAGVGDSRLEALAPAVLSLPRPTKNPADLSQNMKEYPIYIFSAADHPNAWTSVPQFNHIDYSTKIKQRLKTNLTQKNSNAKSPALKIFSVHWGPNYSWHPASEIQELAHFLIDECGVDIIHGHSSHHIQGVEIYKGKPIIYGCGDFVDDYAVNQEYRSDISALFRVTVEETTAEETKSQASNPSDDTRLKPVKLEVFPNRIKHFQAGLLDRSKPDAGWFHEKFYKLSKAFGTEFELAPADQTQIVINLQ